MLTPTTHQSNMKVLDIHIWNYGWNLLQFFFWKRNSKFRILCSICFLMHMKKYILYTGETSQDGTYSYPRLMLDGNLVSSSSTSIICSDNEYTFLICASRYPWLVTLSPSFFFIFSEFWKVFSVREHCREGFLTPWIR